MFLISSNRLKLYINSLHLSLLYPFFDAMRLDMGKDRNYYIYIEEIHMDKWRQRLAGIDDDYLIGISNKGIVKRAYKDKEETAAEIVSAEEEARVKVGEETVTVRFPLGESKCTCPSRSICRHVVQAILTLRESSVREAGAGQGAASAAEQATAGRTAAGRETAGTAAEEQAGADQPPAGQETAGAAGAGEAAPKQQAEAASGRNTTGKAAAEQNPVSGQTAPSGQSGTRNGEREGAAANGVFEEINAYPLAKLKKALGNKYFQTFVSQAAAGIRPEIRYTSVITMQLPEPGVTVKLLSPLEYSTCTCHKKELCRHKAAAILWCRLEAGAVTKEELIKEASEEPAYDLDEVREAAGQMEAFLEELFGTGLSRVSPEAPDDLERLAIISHNAGLARFEGYFRALADSYDRYLKRKAAFQTKHLMEQMAGLWHRVERLRQAENGTEVAALAGEFRADYLPVGKLELIGIAAEQYKSQTGYEGETIYFLEETTKKWYTYTNAKPVFYDGAKRGRESGAALQGPAPWGLQISLEKLLKVRIRLTGVKCDSRNRISSSQETRGEILGDQGLCASDIRNWYYRDFGKLFRERIRKPGREASGQPGDLTSRGREALKGAELVFVRPDSCAKAEFSQTGQQLTLPLYDRAGRELLVEVTYSKEEAGAIRYLERISEKKLPCFLGKVSLRDGRLRMYPVDLQEIEEPDDREDLQGQESSADRGRAEGSDSPDGKSPVDSPKLSDGENRAELQNGKNGPEKEGTPDQKEMLSPALNCQTKYQVMEDIAGEISLLMEDLSQSGFDMVHDSTLKDLRNAVQLTEQYGMKHLSGMLESLAELTEAGRHQMEKHIGPVAGLYADIIKYINLLTHKIAYDRGADYYA